MFTRSMYSMAEQSDWWPLPLHNSLEPSSGLFARLPCLCAE